MITESELSRIKSVGTGFECKREMFAVMELFSDSTHSL
jgi:hypothetical protein